MKYKRNAKLCNCKEFGSVSDLRYLWLSYKWCWMSGLRFWWIRRFQDFRHISNSDIICKFTTFMSHDAKFSRYKETLRKNLTLQIFVSFLIIEFYNIGNPSYINLAIRALKGHQIKILENTNSIVKSNDLFLIR